MKIRISSLDSIPSLVASALFAGIGSVTLLNAQPINVPNASFESPAPFPGFPVNTSIDAWQESPQPVWFNPDDFGGITWDQLSGVFANTAMGASDHINNMDGNQAAYLFAVPTVGLIQDYDTVDWHGGAPTHAFDAAYEVGKSYQLTMGVLGGSGMADGADLRISLYYRDGGNAIVPIMFTDVLYSLATFPDVNNFVDFSVNLPAVQPGDAWAGQHIGIQIEALTLGGTYWDIDNVRLKAVPEPSLLSLIVVGTACFVGRRWVA